jgi:serpin B
MKISRSGYLVLILVAVLALIGAVYLLTSEHASPSRTIVSYETPHALIAPGDERNPVFEKNMTDANNRFALNFYRTLRQTPAFAGRNIFFSPYSISSAFAITYEGARGTTADEIRSVFSFPENDTARRLGYAGIYDDLNNPNASYTFRTANALWAEKIYPFLPEYIRIADRSYGVKTTNLNFIGQPQESRLVINRWVEATTDGRIREFISRDSISCDTRLVITNAVYFNGSWETSFPRAATTDADFFIAPNTSIRVPMMHQNSDEALFRYTETPGFQVLELPYNHTSGKALSMLVLLPKDHNLTAAEEDLDLQQTTGIKNSLTSQHVKVSLPKFSLGTTYNLPKLMTVMGMPTAFGAGADFSGMDGAKSLFIGEAIHKAVIDVNEEGTEATAATAVVMDNFSAKPSPVVFRADHPFLFLIKDSESGNILFMGRVVDPSAMETGVPP